MRSFVKFLYEKLHISDADYISAKENICATNRNSLLALSLLCTVIFLVLFISSVCIDGFVLETNLYVFLGMTVFSVLIFVATYFSKTKSLFITLSLVYVFLTVIFIYSIYVGVHKQSKNYAVSFFVLQFAAPVFFLDRSRRMCAFTFFVTMIFCGLSLTIKDPKNFSMDLVNACCFFVLSLCSSIYLSKLKIKQFNLLQLIKVERDTDGLTGLLNKSALTREISLALARTGKGILMILDCDNFKGINDNFGHDVGDYVLEKISEHVKKIFRDADISGRFGGDEFIIFLPGTDDGELGRARAQYLLDLMNRTIFLPEQTSSISKSAEGSIGIAVGSGPNVTFGTLFKCADNALYEAKHLGKNQVVVAQDLMNFV